MTWKAANSILALLEPSAQTPAGAEPPWYLKYFPFFLLIFVFYFVMLRPQQKRQKQHDQLMKNLRAGDRVTTTSGIIGTVVTVKDKSVSIRSADTKLEVLKTAISEITEREGESTQPQS